ncbi:chemotaxis protein CheX [Stomatohabitans albus]|uniref:chemotaxis protein CheX n=1 Tax=Stomatohabitans albus TaxID=3110766 RepID=UPI00300C8D37
MICTDDDIVEIVDTIWASFFEGDVDPGDPAEFSAQTRTGLIHVHGQDEATINIKVNEELAQMIASMMFGIPAEELADDEITDALGEITNMLGGSVKAYLTGDANLSLPTVITGAYRVNSPGTITTNTVWMWNNDQPILVEIVERAS